MTKDRTLTIRIPTAELEALKAVARDTGVTVTQYIRETLIARTWTAELKRNREYHKAVLRTLSDVEKRIRQGNPKLRKAFKEP
jgi:predicted DNA-binding protein